MVKVKVFGFSVYRGPMSKPFEELLHWLLCLQTLLYHSFFQGLLLEPPTKSPRFQGPANRRIRWVLLLRVSTALKFWVLGFGQNAVFLPKLLASANVPQARQEANKIPVSFRGLFEIHHTTPTPGLHYHDIGNTAYKAPIQSHFPCSFPFASPLLGFYPESLNPKPAKREPGPVLHCP